MVALDAADGYEGVTSLSTGFGYEVLQLASVVEAGMGGQGKVDRRSGQTHLADFVPAIRQTRVTVLALGVDLDFAAERFGHVGEVLHGRGPELGVSRARGAASDSES